MGVVVGAVVQVAIHCACDIGDEADIVRALGEAAEKFGDKMHVLVNNAASFIFHSVETATAADWDASAAVNIKGHALLTKHVLPYMKRAGGGSIVWQVCIGGEVRAGFSLLLTSTMHTDSEGCSAPLS